MNWNWLDILVLLLAVGQIALSVWVVMILLRIKSGAVAQVSAAVGRNIGSGKKLFATGKGIVATSVPHFEHIRASVSDMPRYLRPVELGTDVSYGALVRYLGMGQLLLSGLGKDSKPKKRAEKRPGFAEKAGLIPPVWQKIAPLWGYAGVALSAWREVQKQLPQLRRAAEEARKKNVDKSE